MFGGILVAAGQFIGRPGIVLVARTVTAPPRELVGPDAFGEFVAGAIERYRSMARQGSDGVVLGLPPAEWFEGRPG